MKRNGLLLTIGCALVLSACGGGGGGGGSSGTGATPSTPAPTSTLSPVTAENSTSVAANAYAGSAAFGDSSSLASGILSGVSIAPAGTGAGVVSPVLGLARRAFGAGGPQLLTGVTQSQACSGGGSIAIDATQRVKQTFSNGDTMSLTANNCREDGEVLNGTLSFTVSGVSGDPLNSTGAVTLDSQFKTFSIDSGGETDTLNGDMKIAINVTGASRATLNVSGTSLQVAEQQAGTTVTTLTLANYSVSGTLDGSTMTSAATFSLAGSSNALGKFNYTVKNLQPFVSIDGATPASGSLIVNGAASSVTATAVNSSSVRLDYSAKGDGVVTQTKTLSWTEFLSKY